MRVCVGGSLVANIKGKVLVFVRLCLCVHVRIVVCVRIAHGSVSNSPMSGIGSGTNTLTITISFRISIKYFHQIIISMKCRRLVHTQIRIFQVFFKQACKPLVRDYSLS